MISKRVLLICGLVCLAGLPVWAQEVSAGITGTVTDPSGAAISGATVIATDLDRGTEFPTKTNSDGIYAFPRVPVGRYQVKVEATGFKQFINPELTLEVNQRARLNVAMQIGAMSESVSVTSDAPLLQTDTTQVGGVMDSTTIQTMPLISRNPVALTLLTAGVTSPNPTTMNNGLRTTGGGRPYVNGNREEANDFLLDGADNNFTSDNLVSYQPNPDAIEEFKLITNNASAEFGNFQGGIINVVIKSGTNQYHGNVFEDFRNDKLNADNWARNWQGLARQPLRWNQFGGTLGGPVKKDKLFFFMDYQGLRQATPPALSSLTVMPLAWRGGDFSSLLNTSFTGAKAPIQLYNPYQVDASGNRSPFVGNIIPQSLLSPAAVKLLGNVSQYPAPQNGNITNNYTYSTASYINSDQGDIKLDYKPNDKDYFSSRYSHGRQDNPGVNNFPLLYNSFSEAPFQNGVINWTRTISPTLVNEARVGINNVMLVAGGADKGLGNFALNAGIADAGPGLLSLTGFAYASALGNANIGIQTLFANTTFHYADNLTIIRGKHMMKTGAQLLRQWINAYYASNSGRSGFIDSNGRFTAQNAINPSGTLIGEADFMLGLPDNLGQGLQSGTWGQRAIVPGIYFQDDWRVTNNLTLNLGLRWEYHSPWIEVDNRQSNFGMYSGQLYLAGQSCPFSNCRALYNSFKKDFQPRLGFAYNPDMLNKKLVIRGAYTISSFLEGTGTNLRETLNPPYYQEYAAIYNVAGVANELPGSTLSQGLSALNPKNPYSGANLRLWNPDVQPSKVQQWNLSAEYELPGAMVLTAGYVGQHGTHLMVPMNYAQNILVNGAVAEGPILAGNPTLRNEIAQVSGTASIGKQKYEALQMSLRKRYAMGLEYQFAFTYSKAMSDAIGYYGDSGQAGSQSAYWQNPFNQAAEMGPAYFDTKFNFTGALTYHLPFGKGLKYGSSWNRGVDALLGGWQIGAIPTLHTGFPLTIKLSSDPSGTTARSYRPNVVGTPNDPHQIGPGEQYLDISAYATPARFTFGNIGEYVLVHLAARGLTYRDDNAMRASGDGSSSPLRRLARPVKLPDNLEDTFSPHGGQPPPKVIDDYVRLRVVH